MCLLCFCFLQYCWFFPCKRLDPHSGLMFDHGIENFQFSPSLHGRVWPHWTHAMLTTLAILVPIRAHYAHSSHSRMAMHNHAWPPPFIPLSSSSLSQLNQWRHWNSSSLTLATIAPPEPELHFWGPFNLFIHRLHHHKNQISQELQIGANPKHCHRSHCPHGGRGNPSPTGESWRAAWCGHEKACGTHAQDAPSISPASYPTRAASLPEEEAPRAPVKAAAAGSTPLPGRCSWTRPTQEGAARHGGAARKVDSLGRLRGPPAISLSPPFFSVTITGDEEEEHVMKGLGLLIVIFGLELCWWALEAWA